MLANIAGVVLGQGACDPEVVHRMLESMPGKVLRTEMQSPSAHAVLGWSLLVPGASIEQRCRSEGTSVAWVLDGNLDVVYLGRVGSDRFGAPLLERLDGAQIGRSNDAFALAAYDRDRQELLLARDRMGLRNLFWAEIEDGGIAFASLPAGLLAYGTRLRKIDQEQMIRALVGLPVVAPDTCYRHVHWLPRASILRWSARRAWVHRYWEPRALDLDTSSKQEVVDRYRSLLANSVRRALGRGPSKIAVSCSGGLDSSSVLAMAAHVSEPGQKIIAVTADIGESTRSDTAVARNLAEALKIPWVKFEPEAVEPCDELILGLGNPLQSTYANLVLEVARAAGDMDSSFMLTGALGDLVGGAAPDWPTETLRQDGLRALFMALGQKHQRRWRPIVRTMLAALWRSGPLSQVVHLPTRARRTRAYVDQRVTSLAKISSTQQKALAREREQYFQRWMIRPQSYLRFGKWVLDVAGADELANWDVIGRVASLELGHPLACPDLVELSLNLPWSLRYAGGQTRVGLRRAMKGILHDWARVQRPKIFLDEYHVPLMRRSLERQVSMGLGQAAEFVDQGAWAAMVKTCSQATFSDLRWPYYVILLKRWLGLLGALG